MSKTWKCPGCGEDVITTDFIQTSKTRRICKSCFQQKEDYKNLIAYICTGFNIKAPTGKQVKDIKKFKEMGITYREIQWTIYYIVNVAKKELNNDIALVPYFHTEAMKFVNGLKKAKESSKDITIEETIIITRNKKSKTKPNKTRYIDLASIV